MFPDHITVIIFVGLSFAQVLAPTPSSIMAPMSSQAPPTAPAEGTTEKGSTTQTTETTKPMLQTSASTVPSLNNTLSSSSPSVNGKPSSSSIYSTTSTTEEGLGASSMVATSTFSVTTSSKVATSSLSVTPSSNVTTSTLSLTSSSNFTTSTSFFIPPSTPQPQCSVSLVLTLKLACVVYTIPLKDMPWKDEYKNKSSTDYKELKNSISKLICDFFKRFACKVEILEVSFCKAPWGGTIVIVKVCLHLKPVSTPFYFEDVQLIIPQTTNYTSEPVGVTYSEWKAKDGECKKCDGGGGPFVIESVCESKEYSCQGHKNKSQESKDCIKYCSSASSLVVAAVSNLILAMLISLSISRAC